mmetsp:Transcript_5580/g.10100  ORF Transcript_5580/g.10100 Transcript_5580/m.10100 type:complete len:219 (-) Transcript_5580:941-1597(-)
MVSFVSKDPITMAALHPIYLLFEKNLCSRMNSFMVSACSCFRCSFCSSVAPSTSGTEDGGNPRMDKTRKSICETVAHVSSVISFRSKSLETNCCSLRSPLTAKWPESERRQLLSIAKTSSTRESLLNASNDLKQIEMHPSIRCSKVVSIQSCCCCCPLSAVPGAAASGVCGIVIKCTNCGGKSSGAKPEVLFPSISSNSSAGTNIPRKMSCSVCKSPC